MAEIDDEHKAEEHQHEGEDGSQIALTHHVGLLFHEFLFLLLRVVDGGQLHCCIALHADNGGVQFVTNLVAHIVGGLHAVSTSVCTVFGQQIVLDDIHRGCDAILLHLLVKHFKVFSGLVPTASRHQVVDGLQLAFIGLDVVRLQSIVEHLFCLLIFAQTLESTGTIDIQTCLLLVNEIRVCVRQFFVDIKQFLER